MANKENQSCTFKTSIGGQALIEGILMRGPEKQSIVCRLPDGTLQSKIEDVKPVPKIPFVRGVMVLVSSLYNGMSALSYAASLQPEETQEEPSKIDKWLEKHLGGEAAEKAIIGLAVVVGIALSIGLFVLLPAFLFELLPDSIHLVVRCILEGLIRIVIFLVYLWLAARMKEIKRVFSYHGAEHKTIFCYEKGLELNVENVRQQSRFHPRCGTSFLVVVMIISIFVVSVMTWVLSLFPGIAALPKILAALVRVVAKLILLPFIVGITYELNRWVGRHDENPVARAVAWPGKQIQHLTTREPDDGMIEVAIEAVKLVIPEVKGADEW